MIWFWILLALGISYLFFRKRNIQWIHFLWLLLPIENYGLEIGGSIIKPYLIFGLVIICKSIIQNRRIRMPKIFLILVMCIFFTDIINGLVIASVLQHILFLWSCYIFISYVDLIDKDSDYWRQIGDACVAMLIGYGFVFFISSFFMNAEGVASLNRYEDSIFLGGYTGSDYASSFRLRGFTIDPNACISILLPGFCYSLFNFNKQTFRNKIKSIIAIFLYIYSVYLTDSRMAQLFTVACFVFILASLFRNSMYKRRWIVIAVLVPVALLGLNITFNINITTIISDAIFTSYTQRSGLSDDAGRVTIWITNMRELFELNRWPFGVGQNQIQYYSPLSKPCHNTYLEWICGNGVFVGTAMDLYIITGLTGMLRSVHLNISSRDLMPFIVAFGAIMLCLLAVDHISNPCLLALLFLFKSEIHRSGVSAFY